MVKLLLLDVKTKAVQGAQRASRREHQKLRVVMLSTPLFSTTGIHHLQMAITGNVQLAWAGQIYF